MLNDLPGLIDERIYFFGFWEPAITQYVASRLQPGDTFVDVGANVGYYSLLASNCVGPNGKVYAFEASPSIFARLQQHLAANAAVNVVARNVAVADETRQIPIYVNTARLEASTILDSNANRIGAYREATVPGDVLANLVAPHILTSARFIKIDVEGAEWLVVKGMHHLVPLLGPRTEILIEVNAESAHELGGSASGLLETFTKAGFSVFEINNEYDVRPYIKRDRPRLRPYDGTPFVQKDFVLKRVNLQT